MPIRHALRMRYVYEPQKKRNRIEDDEAPKQNGQRSFTYPQIKKSRLWFPETENENDASSTERSFRSQINRTASENQIITEF